MMEAVRKKGKIYMVIAVVIALICAIRLCAVRIDVEQRNMTIEQAMDYESLISMAKNDGYDEATVMQMAKDAGINSFAVYDTTLNKLAQRGDVSLLTALAAQLYYPQLPADTSFDYYVVGKKKTEVDPYFDEVKEDLQVRLGNSRVRDFSDGTYRILGLKGAMPDLGDVNLGILSADANRISQQGFGIILRPTNYMNPDKSDIDRFFKRVDKIHGVTGIMFVGKEVLGYTADTQIRADLLKYTADKLKERHLPFYMIEAANQLQYDQQEGMYSLADAVDYDTVRVYAMSKDELDKLDEEEGAMRFYISDLERNCRVNLYPVYKRALRGTDRTTRTFAYVGLSSSKLTERGYKLGKASIMDVYYPQRLLSAIISAGALLGILFTLNLIVPLSDRINRLLSFLAVIVGFVGEYTVSGPLFLQVLAIGCAVSAPVAAVLILLDIYSKREIKKKLSYLAVIRDGTIGLACAVVIAAIGGIFIAALLGDIRFFMEFDFYRGVKLTFVLPLVLTALAYLRRFPLLGIEVADGNSCKEFVRKFLDVPVRMGTLIIIGALAMCAYIFVGRSGHTAGVPVPGIEVAMRRFLENVMFARPREKEFLIGHPAFFLMVASIYRKWPQLLHFFLVIASVIGVGSMVETFAHIRTPFILSFIRGVNGWLTGTLIGIGLIVGIALIGYLTSWLGKQVRHER